MITFKEVRFRNFMSYGNVPIVISFGSPGTTLIVGENGSGKTTALNALVYGVYGKPLSNISKNNLINNINGKDMEVSVSFDKGKDSYVVERYRKGKTRAWGNVVSVSKNGENITPDSVHNTDAFIEKIIGISYDLFVRIVVFSASHLPFLDLPLRSPQLANQCDIIEQLFDLKILSTKAEKLKQLISDNEKNFEIKNASIELLKKERARHIQQIETAKQRMADWEENKKKDIKGITKRLEMIEGVDIETQKRLFQELSEARSDLKDIEAILKKKTEKINKVAKDVKKLEGDVVHLQDEKCPYCRQKYPSASDKIKEVRDQIDKLLVELSALTQESYGIEGEKLSLNTDIQKIEANITVSNLDEIIQTKSESDSLRFRLDQLKSASNPHLDHYKELRDMQLAPINTKELDELSSLLDHQRFLFKLLTKRDSFVRKNLLERNLPYLNARLEDALADLGLPHVVRFTQHMTASITRFGKELDFGNLSNGQRARLNLALSFAFRDVLQKMHMPINVCLLDEVLDVALDDGGISDAITMIKARAKTEKAAYYIISHKEEISNVFDHKIVMEVKDGFSQITIVQ